MISVLTMAEATQTVAEPMQGWKGVVGVTIDPMLSQTGQWQTLAWAEAVWATAGVPQEPTWTTQNETQGVQQMLQVTPEVARGIRKAVKDMAGCQ